MSRMTNQRRASDQKPKGDTWLVVIAVVTLLVLPSLLLVASAAIKLQLDREHVLRAELQSVYDTRSQMRSVLIDLQDAETGQRGYLLTGREIYLAPYQRARDRVADDLRQLRIVASARDKSVVAQLTALSDAKFTELAETIALSQRGRKNKALTVVQSDRGQFYMDSARKLVAVERAHSSRLMTEWTSLADQSARTTEEAALAVGVLMILTLAASAALIGQIFSQRRQTITTLGLANKEVSALLRTFAIAERVSNGGHWSLTSGREHYWSEGMLHIFGFSLSEPAPDVDQVLNRYVEADRSRVEAHLECALTTHTGFAFEAEIATPEGLNKSLCLEAEYVDDTSGGALVGVVHDVTAEREIQKAMRHSEERYRHLADNSTDMMATMALDSTILFVSPACRRILGYDPDELIGRKTLAITHPDDLKSVLAVFAGLREAGPGDATYAYRFRGRHKDGQWVWLEGQPRVEFDVSGTPVSYQDVVREISSRKAAEDALEASRAMALESERRYRLLAENATDVIAQYELDGTIKYVSPACKTVLGYNAEELLGRSTFSLIHPEDLERIRGQFSTCLGSRGSKNMQTEHRTVHRDGTVIWLEGRPKLAFNEDGQPIGYSDVMRDITTRKTLEAELREARTAAEGAARSKADFLANMSHELRTPLNSVVGFSGLISEAEELTDETRYRANIIKDSSRALVAIVDDILDFSKFEAEGVKLMPEPCDLGYILRSTTELMQQQVNVKGIELRLELAETVGLVLVDAARIRQVMLNLIGNAVKFTDGGAVTVVLAEALDGALTVSVQDTGVGISEDRLGRIFERFAQADASTSRRYGGTGLGLAICSSIVRAMKGQLSVASCVGEGSTFWFTINPPRITGEMAPPRVTAASIPSAVSGLRVLLADDNVFNQELFAALMKGRGLDITFVSNGREAVEAASVADFDLVLMDMQMPVMDGLDATRAIRSQGLHQLPIVALTANVVASQIELCLAAGMDDHLAKPYTTEAALAVMTKWTTETRRSLCLAS